MAIYKIKEIKDEEIKKCCICGEKIEGWGNNPWPIKEDGECCDKCNYEKVVPARIKKMYSTETTTKDISIEELSEEEKKAIEDYKKAISETNNPKLLDLFAHILKEETEHLEELQSQTAKDSVKDNDHAYTDEELREIHKKLHEMINEAILIMDPDSDMDLMTLFGDYGKIVYRLHANMKNGNFELGDPDPEYASVSYNDEKVYISLWFDPKESKKKVFVYGGYIDDLPKYMDSTTEFNKF